MIKSILLLGATCVRLGHSAPTIAPSIDTQQDSTGKFTFYQLPTPLAGPCDLTKGPDGALWGEDILFNAIFRLDPTTGSVSTFPIPFTTPLSSTPTPNSLLPPELASRTAFSCAIRAGADGNLYASNGLRNQLVRINPNTTHIDIFEPPHNSPFGNLEPFNDLYTSASGMWMTQTTANVFQVFSYKTKKFTIYEVPTPAALPLGVFVASDGVVYIAEVLANKILTFDPRTEKIEEWPLPEPAQLPSVIRAERDGYVYFVLATGNGIGRIAMDTKKIELFHTNQIAGLGSEDTIDKDGGVWMSFFDVDALARLDTKTLEFSYVAFPETLASIGGNGILGDFPPAVDIAVNYGPGNAIWFTDILHNRVGRLALS